MHTYGPYYMFRRSTAIIRGYHLSHYLYIIYIHSFTSIQPLGRFSRNQNPVRRTVWLWHTASWANS